jgi:hypothetical protein
MVLELRPSYSSTKLDKAWLRILLSILAAHLNDLVTCLRSEDGAALK